ncbi:TPA_asm: hypothetical protein vir556_00019 [dsDNA virus vir556]|nr:TPA_asm: hypothetical protein vir556_00019 [dsDNA virus vir556]
MALGSVAGKAASVSVKGIFSSKPSSSSLTGPSYSGSNIQDRMISRSPSLKSIKTTPTPAAVPTSLSGGGGSGTIQERMIERSPSLVPISPSRTISPSEVPVSQYAAASARVISQVPSYQAAGSPVLVPTGPVTAKIIPTANEMLIARNPDLKPLGGTTVRTDVIEKIRTGDTETIDMTTFIPAAPLPGEAGYVGGTKDLDPINIAAQVTMVARNPGLKILDKSLEAAIEALELDSDIIASGDPTKIAAEVKRVFSEEKFKPLIAQARYEEVRGTLGPLHIQSESYSGKTIGVERLRGDIDTTALIKEGLAQFSKQELSDQRKSDLATKYPDIAMALLTGEADLNDVDWFFRSVADLEEQGQSVGFVTTDDENRLGRLVAKAKQAGASEDTAQALVAQYINRLDTESKRKMSEWIEKGGLKENANMHLKLDDPGAELGDWMRDPTNQLYLTAAGVVAGGAGGLALKGLAGLAGGAVMGVFAGTELPNLSNSSVFAESTIRKLEAAGAKDASMNIGDFRDRHTDATRAYNDALKRGDLAEADRQARNIMEIQDDYADYVVENFAAYQKAGILEEVRGNIVENYDLAASQRLSTSPGSNASAKYDLSGFDPKSDWVRVNGVTLSYFSGNSLELPPGEFVVEWGRSGYDPASFFVEVDKDGDIRTVEGGIANNRTKAKMKDLTANAPTATEFFKGTTKTTTTEKASAYADGVDYKIVWQPGWQVQDPYTLEWKSSGDLKIKGDGATNVVFLDPDGNLRYTRVTNNDPYQSKYITGLESMPMVDKPYEQTRQAPKANTGTVIFGQDRIPGAEYYWDGKRIDPSERAKPVLSGDHTLIIRQEGMKDLERTVSVSGGETNYLSMYHVMTPVPEEKKWVDYSKQSQSYGGGGGGGGRGGGGGGGYSYSSYAPAVKVTTINYGQAAAGAEIYQDEIRVYPVIGEQYSISPGYHAIRMLKAGKKPWSKTVYVGEGDSITVSPAFEDLPAEKEEPVVVEPGKKRIYINSVPSDAKILLDGLATGQWTPGYLDLEYGYYIIGISKTGYVLQERPIWVNDIVLWDDAAKNAAIAAGVTV